MVDIPTVFYKDAGATLDYWVEWSTWLGTDTISSVSWQLPSPLTSSLSSFTSTRATIWIGGGEVGEDYKVTCHIVTAGGRTDERSFTLKIVQR